MLSHNSELSSELKANTNSPESKKNAMNKDKIRVEQGCSMAIFKEKDEVNIPSAYGCK